MSLATREEDDVISRLAEVSLERDGKIHLGRSREDPIPEASTQEQGHSQKQGEAGCRAGACPLAPV
jgi:hypothetical protein